MIYTAENLPVVDPMDIRRITPEHEPLVFGGVILMSHYSAKPIRRTAAGRIAPTFIPRKAPAGPNP